MTDGMTVKIVSPSETVFEGKAKMLSVMGIEGSLSVMKGHVPFATPVKEGPVRIYDLDGEIEEFNISGGLLTVGEITTLLIN